MTAFPMMVAAAWKMLKEIQAKPSACSFNNSPDLEENETYPLSSMLFISWKSFF